MPYATAKDGVKLYLEECGAGKCIIFIHEFAGDHASYEPQMRNLARRFRCVSFNARGFPPSDVPSDQAAYSQLTFCTDVIAIMDHLTIEAAHLVGVSMGAFTALYTALDHPQRVSSLVVAGCGFAADPKSRDQVVRDIEMAAARIETEGTGVFAETYAHGPARIQFKLKDPRGWEELKKQLSRHSVTGSAMTLRGVQRDRPSLYSLGDRLAQLQVPVLIVAGDEDEPCLDASLYLKRTLPNSGLSILPHTGHTVNLEEPAAFNRLCIDFFDAVDRGMRRGRHNLARSRNAFGAR
jgi:pimeloyl-ACP methyl ester carboxylesterase